MTAKRSPRRRAAATGAVLSVLALMPSAARADDADGPKVDKSGFTLLNPTPESALRSFAPDRPAKSTGPTTVDAGHTQVEVDLFNFTHQRVDGIRTTTWIGPNPTLKVGITNWLDLQANIAPFVHLSIEDTLAGTTDKFSGQGDLFLRAKANLWGNDGGKTAFALIPWVKVPTAADGLGNNATEGGVIASLSVSLPRDMSLSVNSEIDTLKDATAGGHHANYVNIVGLNLPVIKDVTFTGEFWSQVNDDPSGSVLQMSLDAALAWTVRPNTQLDIGANFGLNRDTPQLQVYGGIAQRF